MGAHRHSVCQQGSLTADSTERISLAPLSGGEAAHLVGRLFAGTGAPPEFLSQASAAIAERSCGLPLFVEQMAVHLRQVPPSRSDCLPQGSRHVARLISAI